jgi:hypothetical protein
VGQLFEIVSGEGLAMPYTMDDFVRDYIKGHFPRLTRQEREDVLRGLSPQEREELRKSLEQMAAEPTTPPRKPRRKK